MNVKEQVYDMTKTSTIQAVWNNGQELTIHGRAYSLKSGFVKDFGSEF